MEKNREDSFSGRKRFKTKTGVCPLKEKMQDKCSVEFSEELGKKNRRQNSEEDCDPCK